MAETLPLALQLCPFSNAMEAMLEDRLWVVRWFEFSADEQAQWLSRYADQVRVVATGGHIGCPADLMRALTGLQLVAINGVGFDKVDLALARQLGVRVSTTPGTLTDDVADLAVGLIIAQFRRIPAADRLVRDGAWPGGEMPLARKVTGSRFGILGLGNIGGAVADRLRAFGEVAYSARRDRGNGMVYLPDPVELARWADVLVVACAATDETRNLVDAEVLAALGPRGVLINVARGSVVDEAALIAALASGTIEGAALDVFADEPRVPDALRAASNTVLTPHIASATAETRQAMADLVMANIDAVLAGTPLPSAIA
ncbi:MAG: 2-hydroxyacid dehydrogenase [Croceibacterium sp.]